MGDSLFPVWKLALLSSVIKRRKKEKRKEIFSGHGVLSPDL